MMNGFWIKDSIVLRFLVRVINEVALLLGR